MFLKKKKENIVFQARDKTIISSTIDSALVIWIKISPQKYYLESLRIWDHLILILCGRTASDKLNFFSLQITHLSTCQVSDVRLRVKQRVTLKGLHKWESWNQGKTWLSLTKRKHNLQSQRWFCPSHQNNLQV